MYKIYVCNLFRVLSDLTTAVKRHCVKQAVLFFSRWGALVSSEILMLVCSCRVSDSELATILESMVTSKSSAVLFFPCLIPPAFTREDLISKLKEFPKLDFQSKQEVINEGRPILELNGLLPTTGQKITRSF